VTRMQPALPGAMRHYALGCRLFASTPSSRSGRVSSRNSNLSHLKNLSATCKAQRPTANRFEGLSFNCDPAAPSEAGHKAHQPGDTTRDLTPPIAHFLALLTFFEFSFGILRFKRLLRLLLDFVPSGRRRFGIPRGQRSIRGIDYSVAGLTARMRGPCG